jgi:hypothetical protein
MVCWNRDIQSTQMDYWNLEFYIYRDKMQKLEMGIAWMGFLWMDIMTKSQIIIIIENEKS